MTTDTMRAEFEAWAGVGPSLRAGDGYADHHVDYSWLAWQASAEAERGRVIEECAAIADEYSSAEFGVDNADIRRGYSMGEAAASAEIAKEIRALKAQEG